MRMAEDTMRSRKMRMCRPCPVSRRYMLTPAFIWLSYFLPNDVCDTALCAAIGLLTAQQELEAARLGESTLLR